MAKTKSVPNPNDESRASESQDSVVAATTRVISFRSSMLFASVLLVVVLVWLGRDANWLSYPLKSYQLQTQTTHVNQQEINTVLQDYLGQSFWEIRLPEVQARLQQIDWVWQADVSRKWPSELTIALTEQTPIARWGEDGLINQQAEVFYPHKLGKYEQLVRIDAPLKMRQEALQQLIALQQELSNTQMIVTSLSYQADHSWRVSTLQEIDIYLPYDNWAQRLALFFKVFNQFDPDVLTKASGFDLRYSNGFTIAHSPE